MFKLVMAAVSAFLLCVSQGVQAAEASFEEGVHYEARTEMKSAAPEIREFFSFWCGHCFAMQGTFERVAETFKDQAVFVRNPVSLMGGAMGPESQQAFAVAKLAGLEDLFVHELFNRMHVEGEIPHSRRDFVHLFEELGLSASKFERDRNSFPVAGMVAEFDTETDRLQIDAVPEIVVNGKYVVKMSAVDNEEDFIKLIGYVLTLD